VKAFYIAGTHWDREWYQPFQEYRMWLVQTIDNAMEVIEQRPDFRVFHLDGQTVLIEDYLEIRPDKRKRLLDHINAGRMPAGPWYVLGDEWLVSGEAVVRNLQVGMRRARRLGFEPTKVGYLPDLFGHVAGVPTILAGFDLKGCVVWRGITDDRCGAQFVWRGPDGSPILTHKLPDDRGYGAVRQAVRVPWIMADRSEEKLVEVSAHFMEREMRRANVPLMFLPDALDHQKAEPHAPEMLDVWRKTFPHVEFVHASMEQYFDALEQHRDDLPEVIGELRTTAREADDSHWLIPHTVSSRYPLKQLNDRCQNMLTFWAEPLAAMAALSGRPVPEGYLEAAWVWLLKNQPHDSICGCSIDAVHEDMMFRYQQSLMLADAVRRQAMAGISQPTNRIQDAWRNVVLHNPLPWQRDEVVVLDLLFPPDFEPKASLGHSGPIRNQFELSTPEGNPIPYQTLEIAGRRQVLLPDSEGRHRRASCDAGDRADVYRVALPVRLPAGGHTTVTVRPLTDRYRRDFGSMRTGPLSAGNDLLRFELRPDGTGILEHRESGRRFEGLFCYEDSGDAGDGWTFIPPPANDVIVSPGHGVECGVAHDGTEMVTFRVERTLRVPEGLDGRKERRSDRKVELNVTDLVTLTRTSPYVAVRTVVENTARNHRLRVLHPSGVRADSYYADQAFAFVERPVALDPESVHYKEADPDERPHGTLFGIEDGRGGLAVLCPEGLHAHSVLDDDQRTLALTLLRGFERTVMTDGEPGGQILGRHEFRYALLPYAGALDRAEALRLTAALQTGVYRHYCDESLAERSIIALEGDPSVVATSIKPAWGSDDVVVRLWNTGGEAATAALGVDADVRAAWSCNLNEERRHELQIRDGKTAVEVPPYGLATVRLVMG